MSRVPDKFFDWVVADPVYGIDGNSHRRNQSRGKLVESKEYDTALWSQKMPSQRFFDEVFRVSKNQVIFGVNYFTGRRNLKIGGGRLVWDKVNGETNFSDAEIAYCSAIESVRIFPFMWNGMQQGSSAANGRYQQGNKKLNEPRIHPTQKPVELYRKIFSDLKMEGAKVFDSNVGSGSSRIAATLFDIKYTGTEIHKPHWQDQEDRFFRPSEAEIKKYSNANWNPSALPLQEKLFRGY